jgi:carbamate kinase
MDHLQHSIKHIVDNGDKVVIFLGRGPQVVNVI